MDKKLGGEVVGGPFIINGNEVYVSHSGEDDDPHTEVIVNYKDGSFEDYFWRDTPKGKITQEKVIQFLRTKGVRMSSNLKAALEAATPTQLGSVRLGADMMCPKCGGFLGKQSEVEGNSKDGGCKRGESIKIRCQNCGQTFPHKCAYDTRDNGDDSFSKVTPTKLAGAKYLGTFTKSYTVKVNVTVARWDDGQWEIRDISPYDLDAELRKQVKESES